MATMHPDNIEDYDAATEGEKRVFRFLKEAARPDEDFICWYEPPIGSSGKEPDFVIFGKRLGLLVLEVKDWTSRQITSYNPHQFTVRISGKQEKKTNPDRQARGYVNALKNRLSEFPEFLSNDPKHKGNLKIPIGRMVVFPNISREDYAESGFKWLIPSERVLFRDDLDPAGEILSDRTGYRFSRRISDSFPFSFRWMPQGEIEKLGFVIWPDVQIDLPLRHGAGKAGFQREVLALDDAQARLALRIGSGHTSVKDLQKLRSAFSDSKVVPIHTYYPERFTELFGKAEIHKDGECWEVF